MRYPSITEQTLTYNVQCVQLETHRTWHGIQTPSPAVEFSVPPTQPLYTVTSCLSCPPDSPLSSLMWPCWATPIACCPLLYLSICLFRQPKSGSWSQFPCCLCHSQSSSYCSDTLRSCFFLCSCFNPNKTPIVYQNTCPPVLRLATHDMYSICSVYSI